MDPPRPASTILPMARRPLLPALLLLLAAAGARGEGDAAVPRIRVRARFDPDRRSVSGTAEFSFVNRCARPLDAVLLHAYPNRFLEPNPALNDVTFPWSYPRSFDPGWMELPRLSTPPGNPRPADAAWVEDPARPPKTLLRVRLDPPLAPGATLALTAGFDTRVPLKFGTFGRYDGDVLLNGGWHPYLPPLDPEAGWLPEALPPEAEFDVELERPEDLEAVLNGAHVRAGEALRFRGRARFLTLALAGEFHRYEASESGASVTYFRTDESSGSGRRVCEEAARALRYAKETYGPVEGRRIVLLEGHFRTVLTDHGDGVGLLSDRILRVLPYPVDLRKYHLREVAFEVFYLLGLERARAAESDADWNWVAEGLAWLDLRGYLAWKDASFDEVKDVLGTFSFIPVIDQTLVAPRFPFNDVFFDTFFKVEPLREGILRHNNGTPFGRLVIEKARDTAGERAVARALRAHRAGLGAFPAALEAACGRSLARFLERWRKGFPPRNYRVGDVREERLGEGRVRITVEILREGGGDFPEIVELGVKCDDGKRYLGKVLATGERTTDAWVYPDASSRIAVDPRVRIQETQKTDNHLPRKPKVLVTAFNPRLEMEMKSPLRDSKFSLEL
ncbi:MAG: hypothetical protein MUC63_02550, partial [Planctomycetes bacterium]|nr:hypothetical protein [Planctomycetota bacterium]